MKILWNSPFFEAGGLVLDDSMSACCIEQAELTKWGEAQAFQRCTLEPSQDLMLLRIASPNGVVYWRMRKELAVHLPAQPLLPAVLALPFQASCITVAGNAEYFWCRTDEFLGVQGPWSLWPHVLKSIPMHTHIYVYCAAEQQSTIHDSLVGREEITWHCVSAWENSFSRIQLAPSQWLYPAQGPLWRQLVTDGRIGAVILLIALWLMWW